MGSGPIVGRVGQGRMGVGERTKICMIYGTIVVQYSCDSMAFWIWIGHECNPGALQEIMYNISPWVLYPN